jgi:predicted outer membrane repeat protein
MAYGFSGFAILARYHACQSLQAVRCATLVMSLFAGAQADMDGGAMSLALLLGDANLTQVVFKNNSCLGRGGALSVSAIDSTLQVNNASMVGNLAPRVSEAFCCCSTRCFAD